MAVASPSSRISERFADQYQECQEAFSAVLRAARDREMDAESFDRLCKRLNKKIFRLKKLGDELAEARGIGE